MTALQRQWRRELLRRAATLPEDLTSEEAQAAMEEAFRVAPFPPPEDQFLRTLSGGMGAALSILDRAIEDVKDHPPKKTRPEWEAITDAPKKKPGRFRPTPPHSCEVTSFEDWPAWLQTLTRDVKAMHAQARSAHRPESPKEDMQ